MTDLDKVELERLQQSINQRLLEVIKDHQQVLEDLYAAITVLENRIADLERGSNDKSYDGAIIH